MNQTEMMNAVMGLDAAAFEKWQREQREAGVSMLGARPRTGVAAGRLLDHEQTAKMAARMFTPEQEAEFQAWQARERAKVGTSSMSARAVGLSMLAAARARGSVGAARSRGYE